MKSHLKPWLFLLLVPLLLACNLSTFLGTPAPAAPAKSGSSVSSAPITDLKPLENQARQTVTNFLTALKDDATGQKAATFLSPAMLQKTGGTTISQAAGLQTPIPDFQLSAVTFSPDAKFATIDASLLYQTPQNRRFNLVLLGNDWKIDSIVSQDGTQSYPSTPEEVVQSFIVSYQEAPDKMSQYLSSARLQALPPGGAVAMLNINGSMEGMMIQSAAVNPDPPIATVTIAIRVAGEDVLRVFALTKENGQWKIDSVDIAK